MNLTFEPSADTTSRHIEQCICRKACHLEHQVELVNLGVPRLDPVQSLGRTDLLRVDVGDEVLE